jgi:YVTN family beta-propeller protein
LRRALALAETTFEASALEYFATKDPAMPYSHVVLTSMLALAILAPPEDPSADVASAPALLLVANKTDRTMGIVDPQLGRQVAVVPENDVTGHEVAASPDGRTAYVPIYGNSGVGRPGSDGRSLLIIDLFSGKVTNSLDFGHGVRPHCPVFNPVSGELYVTTELDNSVTIVDPHTVKVIGSIPTGKPESHMLAVSHDGRYGYTANVGSGTVSVLDLKARKTIEVIPVAPVVQRISISMDDRTVFTSDQTKPQLAAIDTATRKLKKWIPLPASGYGTAPTPDGHWLLVAMPSANKVAVVDLKEMKVARTIEVPATPQAAVIRADGERAYVSCDESHKIAAIRTSDWTVEKLIDAGRGADGLAWAVRK